MERASSHLQKVYWEAPPSLSMAGKRQFRQDETVSEGEETPETPAEKVGRTAGFVTKFVVRQALKSKTVRDQIRDAQTAADSEESPTQ